MSSSFEDIKSKSGEDIPFACFVSVKTTNEVKPWQYWSIELHYPDQIIKKAEGNELRVEIRLNDPADGNLSKMANCIIPSTPQAIKMLKGLLLKNVTNIKVGKDRENTVNIDDTPLSSTSSASDWCSSLNSEGAHCMEGTCWSSYEMKNCQDADGNLYGPMLYVEGDDPGDPDFECCDNDPYDPPPGGEEDDEDNSTGGACTSCDPGDSINSWEADIDHSELAECMQGTLNALINTTIGAGEIIQQFANDIPNFNWIVKDGSVSGANARTFYREFDNSTSTVTTIFDSRQFRNATAISIARTILHEAIHAYIVSVDNDPNKELPDGMVSYLGEDWASALDGTGHDFIANNYITPMEQALYSYGHNYGNSNPYGFYEDLSWGGLTSTEKFLSKSFQERVRIHDVIQIEFFGLDGNGKEGTQLGKPSDC